MSEQEPQPEVLEPPETTTPEKYSPWELLNQRDTGQIVADFLCGLSPTKIATLRKRSIQFVYEVLRSPETQLLLQEFETERHEGLMNVSRSLSCASVELKDELLTLARSGRSEGVRLKAIIEALGMSGFSRIQKVQQLSVKVTIPEKALALARQVMQEEGMDARPLNGGGLDVPSGSPRGESLLQQLRDALRAGGGTEEPSGSGSGDVEAGLEAPLQEQPLLPLSGSVGLRQAHILPPSSLVQTPPGPSDEAEADRLASGALQEHHRNESIPDVAPPERSLNANTYYKRNGD